MALENKKLSEYPELTSPNIDATTNLVVLTGVTKVNKKLPVENFIEDTLTSESTVKPLSANQGKILKDEVDLKAPNFEPVFTGLIKLASGAEIGNEQENKMLHSSDGNNTILGNADYQTKIVGATIDMPVSIQIQTALDLKAPKANPIFTGNVVVPRTVTEVNAATVGLVNETAIGFSYIIDLLSITIEPLTGVEGDYYYNSSTNKIYIKDADENGGA